ncbi:MAG: DASH family cryptochrome [Sphingobacteriaceae bacterium]
MDERTILVWFRNDLRIHDNEILLEAIRKGDKILPVYCFDPFYFRTTRPGILKTGSYRARFQIESVADLRESLRGLGGELVVQTGSPEEVIPQIALQYKVHEVYHHREVADEETAISAKVEAALWKLKLNLKHFIGHTLYHKEDLPFPIKDIPDAFTTFRKKVERDSNIRPCFESPQKILTPEIMDAGSIPTLKDLDLDEPKDDMRAIMRFQGGETTGLSHMQNYFCESDDLNHVKGTRPNLRSVNYASRLSPWLSMGCLSPRQIYWEVKRHDAERGINDATNRLIYELLVRDYFRFMFKKHGNQYFQTSGFKNASPTEAENQEMLFENWKSGKTGFPFIDANMRELNASGFMSNRGRKTVASFLVRDMKVNWTLGAAYFEEKLIDYAPASNWGNWANVAGVGNDPREERYFDPIKQSMEFDPKGEYIKKWLPELISVPPKLVHTPYLYGFGAIEVI